MTQNRQNIKGNQYDYIEELKEELQARAASSLVSLDYTDLGQALTIICDCEAAIFKFNSDPPLCIGITQEDWKNFEECEKNEGSCNTSGLTQGNCEISFRLLHKGRINYLCWEPEETDFSELWLLGLQDFPTNAEGVRSILKRIPEIAVEFNIRKHGEAPIDKAPVEYGLPLSRETILEDSIGKITEKLNISGIAHYLDISPDAIRVGFLLYYPLERILKFTSFFNFCLSPLAKSDELLESKQSEPLVNVARVLLDKGLKTYLGELENAKQCGDATRITCAVEILNNGISEIKSIEDIKNILTEIRKKTQGICVENEADNDLLKGIEKELPKWFKNAMKNCDFPRNPENDPHEEFFKYLGREIEQPYHTGIPFYFIDSQSPAVFKNLIEDAKRVDKRVYNNWRTRILQCIEVYLGEGGIHEFVKAEIRETSWLILVPLYSRGQKKGIMYIQHPYYVNKDGHITGGCNKTNLQDFLENKGEFSIYNLLKAAVRLANQIGEQIQSVDDERFLFEISTSLSKIR
ncbi:TPA: hypothetical protein EYP70_01625, partial [Candidatus Bathyarchaeota archaeon]|nr:hypothetical protein [Candidatus Bathyarchaeota archaeon]